MGNNEWVRLTHEVKALMTMLEVALSLFEDECTPDEPACFTWKYQARDALASFEDNEIRALLTVAKEAVELISDCAEECRAPTAEWAHRLEVAIADVEGER